MKNDSDILQPVILCGGSGIRLWPASRESYPKQLLALLGDESLLQSTLRRIDGFSAGTLAAPIVVSNEEYRFIVAEQMRQVGIEHPRLLLEPVGRNTAPALTLAALLAQTDGQDPILLAMPADHVIAEPEIFCEAVTTALPAARAGTFVTFGIVPTRAETGYGYLRRGTPIGDDNRIFTLDEFVEKPDGDTAQNYLESGQYLWNSGIFMLRASAWLGAMATLQPAILDCCARALGVGKNDGDFMRVDRGAFGDCPADSIDYAVMEKLRAHPELGAAVLVPLRVRWSDVGAWDALWDAANKDAQGNVARGDVLLHDTRDSLVLGGARVLVALGCEDMVIVDTPDALLVADKRHTLKLREVVAELKKQGREEVALHRKVFRPWGWYDSVDKGTNFQVKRIGVNPGASLSLQMHHRRAEHWVVVRGTARVTCGEEVFDLHENESTFIPLGSKHRLQNMTGDPLEIIEVQCGGYLGEDDIVRFEDVYARA